MVQFFGQQQTPVGADAFDLSFDSTFRLEGDYLVRVQPMLVVESLKVLVKAGTTETLIQAREGD